MVKKALAILICLSLLIQCVAHLGIIGYYELNKEFIIKYLCENRDKPEKKCCGKCYVRKQINKVSDNTGDSNSQTVKVEKTETVYVMPQALSLSNTTAEIIQSVFNPRETHLSPLNLPISIFHPPSVC